MLPVEESPAHWGWAHEGHEVIVGGINGSFETKRIYTPGLNRSKISKYIKKVETGERKKCELKF